MYIFFDVETTGLPLDYKAPVSNTKNRPHIVQIAWLTYDHFGNLIQENNHIIKPDGFVIPDDVAKIHRITTQKAIAEGKDLTEILNMFCEDILKSEILVAHNLSFDKSIIGAELYRKQINSPFTNKTEMCTMKDNTNFCKIPSPRGFGYKRPTLAELYYKIFKEKLEDAHDAIIDTYACAKCFFEIQKIKQTQ